MTTQAVKGWLKEILQDAQATTPASFPRGASNGLLLNAGFGPDKLRVLDYRPAKTMLLDKANVSIQVMESDGKSKTFGGAKASIIQDVQVLVTVFWMADFTGKPNINENLSVPPAYTDEGISAAYFETLLDAVENVVALAPFIETEPDLFGAGNWPLEDLVTHQKSTLLGEQPLIRKTFEPPRTNESQKNLLYVGYIACCYREEFQRISAS